MNRLGVRQRLAAAKVVVGAMGMGQYECRYHTLAYKPLRKLRMMMAAHIQIRDLQAIHFECGSLACRPLPCGPTCWQGRLLLARST
eukprot:4015062-Amphidinium_carterae.1